MHYVYYYHQLYVQYFSNQYFDDDQPLYHLPLDPTIIPNQENVIKWAQIGEEAYQAWLNQPPIQFPLCPKSLIKNIYSNTSSSHVGDESNDIEVGMDDLLQDIHAMDGMLLNAFQ